MNFDEVKCVSCLLDEALRSLRALILLLLLVKLNLDDLVRLCGV